MAGDALISPDVLANYAADAACEVDGVSGLVGSPMPGRRGVRISVEEEGVGVELHVVVAWGACIPEVGACVQRRVAEYLAQMAEVQPASVAVVVDGVGKP